MNKRQFLSTVGLALPCLSIASVIDIKAVINIDYIINTIIPKTTNYIDPIYYFDALYYYDDCGDYRIGKVLTNGELKNKLGKLTVYNMESSPHFIEWECLSVCYYKSFPHEYLVERIHFTIESLNRAVKYSPYVKYIDVMLEDWLKQNG